MDVADTLQSLSPDGVVTVDVLAALDAAAEDACRRLAETIQSILDEGTHLSPVHAERLNAMLCQLPVRAWH